MAYRQRIYKINKEWDAFLSEMFETKLFFKIQHTLEEEESKYSIYPAFDDRYRAFELCKPDNVRVILLGQDPYHGPGQAHGLAFSVPPGCPVPPSLRNIFKELKGDLGLSIPDNGDLSAWAAAGVLLLNSILTVREASPASHHKIGWEDFTDKIIENLSDKYDNLVFMLWGNYARAKKNLINPDRHCILEAAHPSPFSAYRGFLGCRHFSMANQYLNEKGIPPIDWQL